MSPTRIVPGWTTRVLMPRRCIDLPRLELTKFIASRPKRSTNLVPGAGACQDGEPTQDAETHAPGGLSGGR